MKINCESCQAKYSIADEKVAGKVFKIRCKRCGEAIIVRGDEPPPEEDTTYQAQEADPSSDAVWHVVINGEQFGPYQPAQIGELLATGQIDWEAYVWKEGFDNWIPACDVSELVTAISGPEAQQQAEAPENTAQNNTWEAQNESSDGIFDPVAATANAQINASTPPSTEPASMGADPFADEASPSNDLFGEPAQAAASGDVFGGGAIASPFDSKVNNDGVVSSSASPRVSMEQAMTGARNENSVLFSLKNLQALATGSSSSAPPPMSPSGAQAGAGLASGEGSGLIDIRALASAAGIGQSEDKGVDREELMSIGSKTGAFGSLGSPMAPTMPMEEAGKNKIIYAIVGGAAVLAIALVGVAFIIKDSMQPQSAAAVAAIAPSAPSQQLAAPVDTSKPESTAEEKPEELSEGERAAQLAAKESSQKSETSSRKSRSSSKRQVASNSSSASSSRSNREKSNTPEKPAATAPPVKRRSTGKESIDDLLSNALSSSGRKKTSRTTTTPKSSGSKLPEKPSRDDVLRTLRKIQPKVQECGGSGVAMAAIVVAGSGRVKSVRVSNMQGKVASCIALAVRRAKFPPFSNSEFSVNFPFRL